MLPKRLFLLWSVCFLAASSAWADTVAYVDCVSHPDAVQVYGKPRQSQDSVASLPCGERFTVLVNGFIFSRIETGDGKIGYVLSSLISFDRSATSAQQANADRGITKVASASATAASSTRLLRLGPPHRPSNPSRPRNSQHRHNPRGLNWPWLELAPPRQFRQRRRHPRLHPQLVAVSSQQFSPIL